MTVEFFDRSTVRLVQTNASDEMVAKAAWVSNFGDDVEERLEDKKRLAGLINYLYRERHLSPFEHGQFTFYIKTPLFVRSEVQRHRTSSFNELSGRYAEMKPHFYVPNQYRPLIQQGKVGQYTFTPGDDEQVTKTAKSIRFVSKVAWRVYKGLKFIGVSNEVARMVLPLNLYTEFYMTVNPRNLMHFLNLRQADNALYEIREVADQMYELFEMTMPLTAKAYEQAPGNA